MFALLTVGLLPPAAQPPGPAPPGVLTTEADHLPEQGAGLLQVQEGGQVQVGQHQGEHGRREDGEKEAGGGRGHHHHRNTSRIAK